MSSRSASENGDGPRKSTSWNSRSGLLVCENALKTCIRFVDGGSVLRKDIASQSHCAADHFAFATSLERANTDVSDDQSVFSGSIGLPDAASSSFGKISQLGHRPVARAFA